MNRFLIVFVAVLGLTSGLTIKEDLLHRLDHSESILLSVSQNFTERGFDYFAGILNQTIHRIESLKAEVEKLTGSEKDAKHLTKEVHDIERHIRLLVDYPDLRELNKASGLYLAAVKNYWNDSSDPTPGNLEYQVQEIILEENAIKKLHPGDELEKAERWLTALYNYLMNDLPDERFPSMEEFNQIGVDARHKVEKYHEKKNQAMVEKFQVALERYRKATYFVGKLLPLDSVTKIYQFVLSASVHYEAYLDLATELHIDDGHPRPHD